MPMCLREAIAKARHYRDDAARAMRAAGDTLLESLGLLVQAPVTVSLEPDNDATVDRVYLYPAGDAERFVDLENASPESDIAEELALYESVFGISAEAGPAGQLFYEIVRKMEGHGTFERFENRLDVQPKAP